MRNDGRVAALRILWGVVLTVPMVACDAPREAPPSDVPTLPVEVITPSVPCAADLGTFGGLRWSARSSALAGPGPNRWNPCNAWLDSAGMHLRIQQRDGYWTSAEVFTTAPIGYGRVEFEMATRIDALDPNVVFGFFTYPTSGADGLHEIDIELARFGATAATAANLNYVVYPAAPASLARGQCSLRWDTQTASSVHRFLWEPGAVTFQSFATTAVAATTQPYRSWRFVPSGAFAISSGSWPLHMNLWLYGGNAPTNTLPVEVIIRRVTYSTTLPSTPSASTACR